MYPEHIVGVPGAPPHPSGQKAHALGMAHHCSLILPYCKAKQTEPDEAIAQMRAALVAISAQVAAACELSIAAHRQATEPQAKRAKVTQPSQACRGDAAHVLDQWRGHWMSKPKRQDPIRSHSAAVQKDKLALQAEVPQEGTTQTPPPKGHSIDQIKKKSPGGKVYIYSNMFDHGNLSGRFDTHAFL